MATKKKLLQAAAGNAGGAGLNVEDVFSTYLYTGTGSTLNIVNGIDLDGEGGLVWHKWRGGTSDHGLFDTERGVSRKLGSNNADAQTAAFSGYGVTAFNSNGYTLGTQYSGENGNGNEVVSWTWRKAPRFFDCVTYTGDGTVGRNISHNLGSKPGCVIVKKTSGSEGWFVSHRGYNNGANTGYLNMTNAFTAGTSTEIPVYYATDTTFRVSNISGQSYANTNGATYVAYLFAHNDGDGDFGPDGDADIIKCGSYQSDGNGSEISVDLGFEPQFVMAKAVSTTGNWHVQDSMRGMAVGSSNNPYLQWNTSDSESADGTAGGIVPTSNGFRVGVMGDINIFNAVQTYIYIAIRRGTAVPESGTEVFAMDTLGGTSPNPPDFYSGWPVDMSMFRRRSQTANWLTTDRLRGPTSELRTNSTEAEQSTADVGYDQMTGYFDDSNVVSDIVSWMWKRAPGFFDVVAYSGNSTAGRTVSHNLGVAPEMIWVKNRDTTNDWNVWHSALTATQSLRLNLTNDVENNSWFTASPTDQAFFTNSYQGINASGNDYIAYLFASLDGISKVGSYTGDGTSNGRIIDCGFTSGARFVLIKNTDQADNWYVWDSERGIVDSTDPYLKLNTDEGEVTDADWIDPHSSGFSIRAGVINGNGPKYIFYAIA